MAEPNLRSRTRMSALAETHGWTVTSSYGDEGGTDPVGPRCHVTRPPRAGWAAEKEHPELGRVRLVVAWRNGRFSDSLIGRAGSAVATCLPSIGAIRQCITDPTCGYRTEEA